MFIVTLTHEQNTDTGWVADKTYDEITEALEQGMRCCAYTTSASDNTLIPFTMKNASQYLSFSITQPLIIDSEKKLYTVWVKEVEITDDNRVYFSKEEMQLSKKIDNKFDKYSVNPIQNKVITEKFTNVDNKISVLENMIEINGSNTLVVDESVLNNQSFLDAFFHASEFVPTKEDLERGVYLIQEGMEMKLEGIVLEDMGIVMYYVDESPYLVVIPTDNFVIEADGEQMIFEKKGIYTIPPTAFGVTSYSMRIEGFVFGDGYKVKEECLPQTNAPTKVSELENDEGYVKESQLTTTPIVPSYVTLGAETVAENILSVHGFNIAFLTDLHFDYNNKDAYTHASQALDIISKTAPLDLIVFGGDYIPNWSVVCKEEAIDYIIACRNTFAGKQNAIWLKGNHDGNPYPGEELTKAEAFNRISRSQFSMNGYVSNPEDVLGGYGYKDFNNSRVRVIFVNTSDNDEMKLTAPTAEIAPKINCRNITAKQLQWIADNALDFSDKDDASKWKIIVVSHLPIYADESMGYWNSYTDGDGKTWQLNVTNLSDMLRAYISKTNYSVTHNGETCSKDFSTLSKVAVVAPFINGHGHCEKTSVHNGFTHIWIPPVCESTKVSDDGNTYSKTSGTANETSFNVCTFDFGNNKVYAWIYGAGTNRTITFDGNVENGDSGGTIPAVTNALANSIDSDGSPYNNGLGYKENYRISSSGAESAYDGLCVTGFIACDYNDTLYLRDITFGAKETSYYLLGYDASFNLVTGKLALTDLIPDGNTDGSESVLRLTDCSTFKDQITVAYVRFNADSITSDSIVTINKRVN